MGKVPNLNSLEREEFLVSLQHLDCFQLRFTPQAKVALLGVWEESVLNPFIYLAFITLSVGHHGLVSRPGPLWEVQGP